MTYQDLLDTLLMLEQDELNQTVIAEHPDTGEFLPVLECQWVTQFSEAGDVFNSGQLVMLLEEGTY